MLYSVMHLRTKGDLSEEDWKEKKARWRAVLLSVPCTFSIIAAQDIWKISYNKRQAVLQEHESLSRTAMQVSMEVAQMKAIMEAQQPGKGKFSAQLLAQELLKAGLQPVVGGSKQDEEEADGGSLTPTFITQALNVHKSVMSQPRCVELLMDLEHRFGTRSCFHKLSKLNVLAQKPASAKSRIWVLESLHDWLSYGMIKVGDVSKAVLQGDRTHCGFVSLFEAKQKATRLILII